MLSQTLKSRDLEIMKKYDLDDLENKAISDLVDQVLLNVQSVDCETFLGQAGLLAQELPFGLRAFLHNYKQNDDKNPTALVSGYVIDQDRIGKSPQHWKDSLFKSSTLREEIFFVLCGSLIGNPIGWSTQQSGRIVHEIFPTRQHETDQVGFSSKGTLEWHTEDAFHPLRGDYIALMCMRNPTNTPTLVASNTDIDLTQENYRPLFKSSFKIKPDDSHLSVTCEDAEVSLRKAQDNMHKLNDNPDEVSVLFGCPAHPYWRVDPFLMEMPRDKEDRNALNMLINEINQNMMEVILSAGDILFCDNYRTVHGRAPFTPKYHGWDRWLKRLNIVIDLRKSRSSRSSGTSRVFY